MTDTILDIGPGKRPQTGIPGITVCCEPCAEYARLLVDAGHIVVGATWEQAVRLFPPRSFDHVTLLDVIEHLPKEVGVALLRATIEIARVSVHVYTPDGFFPQEPGPDGLDAWGLHGGEWQRHRSGWTDIDFGEGWTVDRVESHNGNPPALKAIWRR